MRAVTQLKACLKNYASWTHLTGLLHGGWRGSFRNAEYLPFSRVAVCVTYLGSVPWQRLSRSIFLRAKGQKGSDELYVLDGGQFSPCLYGGVFGQLALHGHQLERE